MERKPNFERLRKALLCEGEPDYVPLMELGIDPSLKDGFLGRKISSMKDEVEFWYGAGYDYVKLSPLANLNPDQKQPEGGTMVTQAADGERERQWVSEHEGIITSREEFEQFRWPRPEEIDYSPFEKIKPHLPDEIAVVGQYGDIFTYVWTFMGFERFSMALFEDPELIADMFEKAGSLIYGMFETMADYEFVNALWYTDDLAYTEGLLCSPQVFRQYLFPWMKKIGELCRNKGIPYMYHTDGRLWDVMDDLLECGINALHPIEPKAMDIVEVKNKYAGRLCVMGNINVNTLSIGTTEDVENEVKERIRTVGPGGGYCLGSSNSVPEYCKLENYVAMVEACKRWGKYPISV